MIFKRHFQKKHASVESFVREIRNGNVTYLSQAITLIESNLDKHQKKAFQILENCITYARESIRIGITGVPGVGKSTFIEVLGNYLTKQGKKVAVLAIDPSSSINKGSILGDKTRMETLANNSNAFIRPSPAGETLGGVAKKTKESIVLCESAGFDVILIETVGVGQSETTVYYMTDFFLLLKLSGAGDQLQGIKRGIIEMADSIVINKADGENIKAAKLAKQDFKNALNLFPTKESNWQTRVKLCSALEQTGIKEIWEMICTYIESTKKNGYFEKKRRVQNEYWFEKSIEHRLLEDFYKSPKVIKLIRELKEKMQIQKVTPFHAASQLLNNYSKK